MTSKARLLLSIVSCLLTTPVAAAPVITLTVNVFQGFEPLTSKATITTQPNYLNTEVCVVWNSDVGNAGFSCWPHQGQDIPKTEYYTLKRLPAGTYIVQAIVKRVTDASYSNRIELQVISNK